MIEEILVFEYGGIPQKVRFLQDSKIGGFVTTEFGEFLTFDFNQREKARKKSRKFFLDHPFKWLFIRYF